MKLKYANKSIKQTGGNAGAIYLLQRPVLLITAVMQDPGHNKMQSKTIVSIFICLFLAACAQKKTETFPNEPSSDYIQYLLYTQANSMDLLHRMKIGEVKSVEYLMESNTASDAQFIYAIAKESKVISEERRKSIYKQLIIFSIMNEKYDVSQWKNNKDLQSIFKEVQLDNPQFTSEVRSWCWKKPWWSCKEDCQNINK